jgi:predicted RNA-binding Zn ribbon-like protein
VEAGVIACADGRHRLALGEDLRVRTDADFQILRPCAGFDQRLLEPHRSRRTGPQVAQFIPKDARDRVSRFRSPLAASARALLDDPLEQRLRECDASRLDGLQIDGGQQARAIV